MLRVVDPIPVSRSIDPISVPNPLFKRRVSKPKELSLVVSPLPVLIDNPPLLLPVERLVPLRLPGFGLVVVFKTSSGLIGMLCVRANRIWCNIFIV